MFPLGFERTGFNPAQRTGVVDSNDGARADQAFETAGEFGVIWHVRSLPG
ncbi:hypothetical protein [Chitinimonas sp. BJB300]|nr:hypothetical protein [Chitinimonas sp. BJB300]